MDYIAYIGDLTTFRTSLATNELFTIDDDGNYHIKANTTMVVYNGNASISMIRGLTVDEIDAAGIEVIGECVEGEFTFYDGGQEKYESVWYPLEQITTDEDGNEVTYTKPEKFCVFA